MPTTKRLTLFAVSKDEWEGPDTSMKNALDVQQYSNIAKSTSWAEVTSKSTKIKSIALAIVEL